jgi:hypothetical protein
VELRRADLPDADQVGMLTERVYRHEGLTDEDYARQLLRRLPRTPERLIPMITKTFTPYSGVKPFAIMKGRTLVRILTAYRTSRVA